MTATNSLLSACANPTGSLFPVMLTANGGDCSGALTTEAQAQTIFRTAVTLSNGSFYNNGGTGGAQTTPFRKNGVNGNQTLSLSSAVGRVTDTTHSDTLAAADKVNWNRPNQFSTTYQFTSFSMQCNAASPLAQARNMSITAATFVNGTRYIALGGSDIVGTATEANKQQVIRKAATFQNLSANVLTSTSGTATFKTRQNTANGNQVISVSGTGIQSDTTHTDSVVAGDLLCYQIVDNSASGTFNAVSVEMAGATSGHALFSSSASSTATASTWYMGFGGYVGSGSTIGMSTEVPQQLLCPYAATLSRIRAQFGTGAGGVNGGTLSSRVNAGAGNQSVSVGSSSGTIYEDTTHTDTLAANDKFNAATTGASSMALDDLAITVDDGSNTGSVSATGSGSIPTLTLTAPTGEGHVGATGSGTVGTLTLSTPTGTPSAGATASGTFGTLALSTPAGQAFGDDIAQGSIGTITLSPPQTLYAHATQFGLAALVNADVNARASQFGLGAMAQPNAVTRATQMGLLVLAAGGEIPLKPNPLSLQDYGRDQVVYQRMVNMYTEPTPQGPSLSARYPRPGLYTAASWGGGPIRKTWTWKELRYAVSGGTVFRDAVAIGSVPTTGNLRFAFSDDEVVIVSGGAAWYVNDPDLPSSTITQITDPDLPANVIDVAFLGGRFVYAVEGTSQFYYSEVGDAQNIDGLDFATAAENTADHIVGINIISDNLVFFCKFSTEWWYPSSDANNPFYRSAGRRYDKGLVSQETVVEADNSLFFLGTDRMVYRAYEIPLRVSDYAVEDKIRRVPLADLSKCSCVSLNYGGHSFVVLHMPNQGSWVLDIGQKRWYEWQSYEKPYFRVQCSDNDGFIGDMYSGDLMGFDGKHFVDKTDTPIIRVVSSFLKVDKGYVRNFNLLLSCSRGVGTPTGQGVTPIVEMHFSDDEGRSWSNWLSAPLGAMGDGSNNAKAVWTQLGAMGAPGRLFEFRCSDPVFFAPWELRYNEERL